VVGRRVGRGFRARYYLSAQSSATGALDRARRPAIFEANAHLIEQPDLIYPEQVLIVPH
jgi:nucleoid-associated protein YgaU